MAVCFIGCRRPAENGATSVRSSCVLRSCRVANMPAWLTENAAADCELGSWRCGVAPYAFCVAITTAELLREHRRQEDCGGVCDLRHAC